MCAEGSWAGAVQGVLLGVLGGRGGHSGRGSGLGVSRLHALTSFVMLWTFIMAPAADVTPSRAGCMTMNSAAFGPAVCCWLGWCLQGFLLAD